MGAPWGTIYFKGEWGWKEEEIGSSIFRGTERKKKKNEATDKVPKIASWLISCAA